eukprot:177219_1
MEQLNITNIQPHQIIKEGSVQKKGKHFRQWRDRWIVLALYQLYTFSKEKEYENPTQVIELSMIESIATNEEKNILCLNTGDYFNTYFKFDTLSDMNKWVNIIAGYINIIQIPVTIHCTDEKEYSTDFQISVPYHEHYKYKIKDMVDDIIDYTQRKYYPMKFCINEINNMSFIGKDTNKYITDYKKQDIRSKGLFISVNISDNRCIHMKNENDLCEIYIKMRDKNIYSEEGFKHLLEYNHFEYMQKPECKSGEDCESYQRLLSGGNELEHRCHIKIYRHHYIAQLNDIQSSTDDLQKGIVKNADVLQQINEELRAIDMKKWKNCRNHAVLQIMTLAELFEKTTRDVGIAKSSGGGASIIGGGLFIAGVICAPFSGGVSLGLSVAGGSVMLAGGLTTLGSGFVKEFLERDTVKKCIEAHENTQKETRRIAFLLEDYGITFSAITHNISIFNKICMFGGTIAKPFGIVSLVGISKGMKALNALKSAAAASTITVEETAAATIVENALFGGAVAEAMGKVVGKEMGKQCAKGLGYAGGALSIVLGVWDIFEGVKTFQDAEKAIHKLRLLAIDIDSQTEMIMKQYNNVMNMKT